MDTLLYSRDKKTVENKFLGKKVKTVNSADNVMTTTNLELAVLVFIVEIFLTIDSRYNILSFRNSVLAVIILAHFKAGQCCRWWPVNSL